MSWDLFGKIVAALIPIGAVLIFIGRKYELFSGVEGVGKQLQEKIQLIELDLTKRPTLPDCERMLEKCSFAHQREHNSLCAKIDEMKALFEKQEEKRISARKEIEEWNKYVGRILGRVEQFMMGQEKADELNDIDAAVAKVIQRMKK